MREEQTGRYAVIVGCALASIVIGAGCQGLAKAVPARYCSFSDDRLRIELSVPKYEFKMGEPVPVSVTISNLTGADIYVGARPSHDDRRKKLNLPEPSVYLRNFMQDMHISDHSSMGALADLEEHVHLPAGGSWSKTWNYRLFAKGTVSVFYRLSLSQLSEIAPSYFNKEKGTYEEYKLSNVWRGSLKPAIEFKVTDELFADAQQVLKEVRQGCEDRQLPVDKRDKLIMRAREIGPVATGDLIATLKKREPQNDTEIRDAALWELGVICKTWYVRDALVAALQCMAEEYPSKGMMPAGQTIEESLDVVLRHARGGALQMDDKDVLTILDLLHRLEIKNEPFNSSNDWEELARLRGLLPKEREDGRK